MSVNAIRQWLRQMPDAILTVTGLGVTQRKLSTKDRLGSKQRPATVEVIAKQLSIVSERARQEPSLLQSEDRSEPPEAMDIQVGNESDKPVKEDGVDVRGVDCAEASGASDDVAEGSGPRVEEATRNNDSAI